MARRCRSPAACLVLAAFFFVVNELSGAFLSAPQVKSDCKTAVALRASGGTPPPRDMEPSLSEDDTWAVPRTAAEERELGKKQGYFVSDWDRLPVEEKLGNPWVIGIFALFASPFIAGIYVLATNNNDN
eukprot:TRINITY_DN2038_c0_g1_i1.p1 TRINITY_DN2038_c0_g1~~TRINITY_DN2038_c0_g1_i1.p1  ORF type:complete len:129 (-),score=27.79 TRINITY_DN2038_c0_g1_i1:69-455(-)